ncbi:MAG: pyrroloquinoline quinone-dependent dehydrogenase [Chryseolinea sp.]
MKRSEVFNLFIACCIMAACFACSQRKSSSTWAHYRSDLSNSAYSPLTEIDAANVKNLEVAWTFHTGDADSGNRSAIQCNPILANGLLYITSPKLKLMAVDPKDGKEKWRFDPFENNESTGVNRGVSYWEEGEDKRIYFSAGIYLYAIEASTGKLVETFGNHGKIDLREGLGREPATLSVWATSPGVIFDGVIIQGTALGEGYDAAPGYVRAYQVKTGKLVWTFHTIPMPGEPGYETWPKDAYKEVGGVNSWAGMSVDEKSGTVYVPTGSPAFDFYGGNRVGNNLYGNCLLALDSKTGKLKWHYQLVHHDLWDYDLPAPPNLVDVNVNGNQIEAVAQVTKMGMVFMFDRHTGDPVFSIEERPVPTSALLGEEVWATQPFPSKPLPFVRHQFTTDDITNISPESHQFVTDKIKDARYGLIYNPPGIEGVVQLPGTRGGAEWGGAAVDPTSGIMYVNANEVPLLIKMKKLDSSGSIIETPGEKIYTLNNCTMCHGADRSGTNVFPSLKQLNKRRNEKQIADLLKTGKNQMPAFPNIKGQDLSDLVTFLMDKVVPVSKQKQHADTSKNTMEQKVRYVHDGWKTLNDQNGYPGIKPPWGTLNAIDLNTGELLWKVTLGEYSELLEKGLPPTGTQNLGGPAITAGGLIFIGATKDEKFRAFDQRTGKLLWEYKLPAGGYATPCIYESNGKEYVIIAAGGGGKVGSPSGDAYIAFSLK